MLISQAYAQENRALHERYASYGSKGYQWAAYVEAIVVEEEHRSVLDYGCGKGALAQTLARAGIQVAEYDPAIEGKDIAPEAADLVVCLDVLEHVEPENLNAVLSDLARLTKRRIFFDICVRAAFKTLSDGRNAHLTLQPASWWRDKLSQVFDISHWVERSDSWFVYGEAVPKGADASKSKRRRMLPEVSAFVEMVRVQMAAHSDEMSRVETFNIWEGVGDRVADLQMLIDDVIDSPDDPRPKIAKAARLARKILLSRVLLTEERTQDYWRPLFEKHIRIADWYTQDDRLMCIGTPKVGVAGVKVVGARPSDERWEQVKANCARISKRIVPAKAHERRAIIACYGPSLRQTINLLKSQAADPNTDVISVSGAHDFLLEHGIVPAYHVECDPRAHKADNIERPHPQVKYLLGSGVNPAMIDKLDGADISLWHIATSEHVPKFMNELGEPGNLIITGHGSVGLRSVPLFNNLGYRKFGIHGMDCSFADEGDEQWAGKHAGRRQQVIRLATVRGEVFHTSMVLLSYATDFLEMIQRMRDVEIELYGSGLQQSMCAYHAHLANQRHGYAEDAVIGNSYLHIPEQPDNSMIRRPNGFLFPAADTQWSPLSGQSYQILYDVLDHTPKRGVVVQAGGNVGVLAMALAKHFDKVYTFEPDDDNFRCLVYNVTAKNVVKTQVALGEAQGRAGMNVFPANCGSHAIEGAGDTLIETVDSLNLDSCDLIILDVEGYEFFALKGAAQTIKRCRPTIAIEDKGLSQRYGIAKGESPRWLIDNFGYRIVREDKRDVILRCD